MSLEIFLYPKNASKTSLLRFLKINNFRKVPHFIKEMNTSDYVSFMWFDYDNYKSKTGVEATVIRATNEDEIKYNCGEWILHTRTL